MVEDQVRSLRWQRGTKNQAERGGYQSPKSTNAIIMSRKHGKYCGLQATGILPPRDRHPSSRLV